ncbi:MAG TPA: purine-nucleoside phosphorylase [Woeseiaceae bacterium]|nr:purine-nucleoside phosphorylase [Woeseiaceae bacterium]
MKSLLANAVASIESRTDRRCDIALILGSGLGSVAGELNDACSIPYQDIEGFPDATTAGHAGRLLLADWCGQRVAVLQGRMHLYEGWRAADIALPVQVLRRLGAKQLVVTNAAGALNPGFRPGQVMLIEDHLNFTGCNPLTGPNDDAVGLRFPDMSRAYDPGLRQLAENLLKEQGVGYCTGIYAGVTGPSLETSAERRFYRMAGADAIGMSTVLEVIAAVHAGMRVLGFSAITNMATGGAGQQPDTIEEVHRVAGLAGETLRAALEILLPEMLSKDASAARDGAAT